MIMYLKSYIIDYINFITQKTGLPIFELQVRLASAIWFAFYKKRKRNVLSILC